VHDRQRHGGTHRTPVPRALLQPCRQRHQVGCVPSPCLALSPLPTCARGLCSVLVPVVLLDVRAACLIGVCAGGVAGVGCGMWVVQSPDSGVGLCAGPWSAQEDLTIVDAQKKLGNKWIDVAALLPDRTANSIKNRWNATLLPRMRRQVAPRDTTSAVPFGYADPASLDAAAGSKRSAQAAYLTYEAAAKLPRTDLMQYKSAEGNALSAFVDVPLHLSVCALHGPNACHGFRTTSCRWATHAIQLV